MVSLHQGSSKLLMISVPRGQVIYLRMKTSSMWFTTDQLGELIEQLIPLSPGLRVQQLLLTADELTLLIRSCR